VQDQPLTMGETPDLTLTITLLRLGSAALLRVWPLFLADQSVAVRRDEGL
jgi:hypothetical protein